MIRAASEDVRLPGDSGAAGRAARGSRPIHRESDSVDGVQILGSKPAESEKFGRVARSESVTTEEI